MEEFALIMRHQDGTKVASPEQIQQWMKQTMDWIGGIAAQNKFVSGTGLPFDQARVVTTKNGQPVVTNGPFGDIKETIGGMIVNKLNIIRSHVGKAAWGQPAKSVIVILAQVISDFAPRGPRIAVGFFIIYINFQIIYTHHVHHLKETS